MKVFISWSGERSQKYAEILRDWLQDVIQTIDPYFSPVDIDKGARWLHDISAELEHSKAGIICLTPDNLAAPWILFEAGALAKSVERSRVIPILFGVKKADITGPLSQFQATEFSKTEMLQLLASINSANGAHLLEPRRLEKAFELRWPDLESQIKSVSAAAPLEKPPERPQREILEEILQLVRDQSHSRVSASLYNFLNSAKSSRIPTLLSQPRILASQPLITELLLPNEIVVKLMNGGLISIDAVKESIDSKEFLASTGLSEADALLIWQHILAYKGASGGMSAAE